MSARGIVLGSLHKAAEFRTASNGNQFAIFTIRENASGTIRWWRVIAFAEEVLDALRDIAPGSPISIAGDIDAEVWSPPGGEARINWRLTADGLLSPKAKPKTRQSRQDASPKPARSIASASWAAPRPVWSQD